MGSCACPTRPPAHPAKNTAGLKPDPPLSGLLQAAGSLPPGSLPTCHALDAPPTTLRTGCKRSQSHSGQSREPSWAQSLDPHFTPCPPSTPLPHWSCQGGPEPCPAFSRHPALPGFSLWPKPQTPRAHQLFLWVCISALGHLGPLSSRHDPPPPAPAASAPQRWSLILGPSPTPS